MSGIPLGEDIDALWRYVCVATPAGERPQACSVPPDAAATAAALGGASSGARSHGYCLRGGEPQLWPGSSTTSTA